MKIFFIIFLSHENFLQAGEPLWLAFGDLRGHIESCGCDPATDLGGIARIATLLRREKATNKGKDIYTFDLGQNFSNKKMDKIKNSYISLSLKELMPNISLLRARDLGQLSLLSKDLNYVSANISIEGHRRISLKKEYLIRNIYISGFEGTPQEGIDRGIRFHSLSKKILDHWKDSIRKLQPKWSILLFSGSNEDLKKISELKLFRTIISGNISDPGIKPGQKEKNNWKNLQRISRDSNIWQVPLGGTGVLRGGDLRYQIGKSISDLMDSSNNHGSGLSLSINDLEKSSQTFSSLLDRPYVVFSWLDKSYESGSPIEALIDSYEKDSAVQFKAISAARKKDLEHSPFTGASSCVGCHQKAYDIWMNSKHSKAMNTLIKVGKDHTSECVSCHVVGFHSKGGFVSMEASKHFAGVQCENCHGPSKKHILDPLKVKPHRGDLSACTGCHYDPHSPQFNPDTYWKQIAH